MNSGKILIIGIDGVDPSLVERLVAEGKLPHLAEFINDGAFGKFESTLPSLTPVAWTSMITGQNPGRHGILGFVRYLPQSYKLKILNATDRRGETLWQILNRAGKKVGLLNYPALYPPEPIDGFMVGGMLTPSVNSEFTYPAVLREELLSEVRGYDVDINAVKLGGDKAAMLKAVYELTDKRLAATKYLMANKDWDLFFTVITETDRLQHFFWGEQARSDSPYRTAIDDYFVYLDRVIGEIMAGAPQDATIMIVSDHGMGEARRKFFVNEWLAREGFLKFKTSSVKFLFQALFHKLVNLGVKILVGLGIDVERLKRAMPPAVIDRAILIYGYPEEINWKKTRVWFAPGLGEGLVINCRGHFPEGTVTDEDYGELREQLMEKLVDLADPETGERMVKNVYPREEIYHGEATGNAADLILEVEDGYTTLPGRLGGRIVANVVENDISGEHRHFGLIGLLGREVRQHVRIEGARIVDLAPTVLSLFGIGAADRVMDGRVLEEVLDQNGDA